MNRALCNIPVLLISSLFVIGQVAAAAGLNITRLLPDPTRPRIYAISSNAKEQGSILVIDTITQATLKTIPVGKEPTDIDLTENAAELLVMNTTDKSISRINLTSLNVTSTHQLAQFSNRNDDFGGHVVDGPGDVLYYVDEQWGPRLRVYNVATGQVLQTYGATSSGTGNDYGFGDIVVNPGKTALFGWVQYGDGAGWAGSFTVRYDIAPDGLLTPADAGDGAYPTPMDREPFDSQALMTADGNTLVIKDRVVAQDDMDHFPVIYPSDIYSMSTNGKIVATSNSIYPSAGGDYLHKLPVSTTVQAILPDYSAMVYFNTTTKALVWLDLVKTLGNQELGLKIEPGDGATVANPTRLEWFPVTGISRYAVYLGTNRDEMDSATPSSSLYLGESPVPSFNLTSVLVSGQIYFWKIVPVGADGLPSGSGTVRSFRVSDLTLSRSAIAAETVEGVSRHVETIDLQGIGSRAWSVAANVPWITFENSSGTTPGKLVAVMNASDLKAGNYSANITLTSAGDSIAIPVTLKLHAANFMISEADLELPWVYAISQETNNSSQPSFLLRISTATNRIESAMNCGRSVTDLAIHYQENRIYLPNWQSGMLRAYDRTTFTQVQTYQFPAVGPIGYGGGGVLRVAAGKKGRVILEEADQWIDIRLIDTVSGSIVATNSSEYAGDGEADPTGRFYYHSGLSEITRFDLAANTFAELSPAAPSGGSSVVMIGDGSKVTAGNRIYNPQLDLQLTLPAEVRAGTLHGDLLFTSTKAYNGNNGMEMATLPVTAPVMSISGDQKKLFLFPANTKSFQVVDLATITTLPPREVVPLIADGSTVIGTSHTLGWTLEPFASSYRLYFGTDRDAVSKATVASPQYIGSSLANSWAGTLPALALDGEYFWRVDVVGFSGEKKGQVWSFNVAPLTVDPGKVELALPSGTPPVTRTLALGGPSGRVWSATTDTSWITLRHNDGTTPGEVEFDITPSGLATGPKDGKITIRTGNDTFSVPVSLKVIPLNVTKLVAHPTREVVYGINTSGAGEGFSHLLEIDASTANVLRSMPIGFSPTDADLDAATDRLYVSNRGYASTRVVDLTTWTELPSLLLGTDVYKLEVTSRGRVVTEEEDQWIYLGLWNAATGTKLGSAISVREGDGETDPTGNFYYHCDNNSSGAVVTKYDISGDRFVSVVTGPQIGYGSRNLILSGDGSRLFWQGRVMDADLKSGAQMPGEVHAATHNGSFAVGASQIWWSDSGNSVTKLPFEATVAVVSTGDTHLLRFNPTTRTLHSTAFATLTDPLNPFPRPGQMVDGNLARLTWSHIPGALSYQVFIAPDETALQAMTGPVATVTTNYYDLPTPLAFGRNYAWRIDVVTAGGVNAGKPQSFGIRFPSGGVLPPLAGSTPAVSASISDRHVLVGGNGIASLHGFDPVTGVTTPVQGFTQQGYYSDHYFGSSVAVDAGKAAVGAYALDNPADGGGMVFSFRPAETGFWEKSAPLILPAPVAGESFGRGLAASGNQLLAGTGFVSNRVGRVAAYVTEPDNARVQTFSATNGVAGDAFGQVIAMEGNRAIIAAPGRGSSYSRLPVLYEFSRSTDTGLWTQTQQIAIPGASSSSSSATALALSGDWLATNNGSTGAVDIFSRNGSGQWVLSTSIKRTSVAGSSSGFGRGLALLGDQLFVGDSGATYQGLGGGAVFTFRRSGTAWVAGPVITPDGGTYSGFGGVLAAREGWLLAAGSASQAAWIFRVDGDANHAPRFTETIPTQVVAGRPFSTPVRAEDADGNAGLSFDILQGPEWLSLTNGSDGNAILSGTPAGAVDNVQTVQLRVRDTAGGEALHTYQLTLLSATSLPVLTRDPVGGSMGEGQEVVLRADVSGIGPFSWQWYHDGKAIPGANRSTLAFGEISQADSGDYRVIVSNAVGEDMSEKATLRVSPAGAVAGDWPTFGGSARHTGYHPARLGKHRFVSAWNSSITPGHALNRVATGDGKIYVTPQVYFGGAFAAKALDSRTGALVWSHAFKEAYSLNPPTYHNGRVYIQRGNHGGDTHLWALDSGNGSALWSSPHGAQWERYEAPTVTDSGIWVNGGNYGGMYGFSPGGSQTFFRDLAQYDGWTPTFSGGRLFTWVAGLFQEHNPADGATLWSVDAGWDWSGWTMDTVAAISGDSAVVISTTEIVCIDIGSRSIRWRKDGNFLGSPAIAGGRVYAIQDRSVVSYSLVDGLAGPVTTVSESIVSGQPLVLMDHLFVAGSSSTFVVELATGNVIDTLAGGGLLSFANGQLYAAGEDGTLRVWQTEALLDFISAIPMVVANSRADDSIVDLESYVLDSSGSSHRWEVISISNSSIFSGLSVGQDGVLRISYAPYASGTSEVTVRVSNGLGMSATATFEIVLPATPLPVVRIHPAIRLNRTTGLYEQKVTVKNVAGRAIAGFALQVTGLRGHVKFQNATVAKQGGGIYIHNQPVGAGKSVTVTLKYFNPYRIMISPPSVSPALFSPGTKITKPRVKNNGKDAASGSDGAVTTRTIKGQKYLMLTVDKSAIPDGAKPVVEVSSNLTDWFSGSRHATVLIDNARVLQVRDNTPVRKDAKRFIRLKYSR